MDPFRDELEGAHARIERLEAENAELRADLEASRRVNPKGTRSRSPQQLMMIVMFAAMALGICASALFHRSAGRAAIIAPTPVGTATFPGIATAPVPAAPEDSLAPAAPRQTAVRAPAAAGGCNCVAGDPLCACCNPPYVTDPQGNRHTKQGCLDTADPWSHPR